MHFFWYFTLMLPFASHAVSEYVSNKIDTKNFSRKYSLQGRKFEFIWAALKSKRHLKEYLHIKISNVTYKHNITST